MGLSSRLRHVAAAAVLLAPVPPACAAGAPEGEPVWIATASLRRGDAADCARLRQDTRVRASARRHAWSGACESLAGLVLKRALEPGDVVVDGDFGPPPAVMRHQQSQALVRVGGVTVQAPVVVLQDGEVGQRVAVRPLNSSTSLQAQITPGGQLVVLDRASNGASR
ncbi:MAG: flagellar basal body P-ring formation protein FlgA [Aquabacterium sp.]|nr:MAG: flagellar basal body P-ring formation protein FlgA [Aquabacterium sp.]TAL22076.1 MAG: flagellar basal body P-ring formation protein FlgA [Aquabacterium sp.]